MVWTTAAVGVYGVHRLTGATTVSNRNLCSVLPYFELTSHHRSRNSPSRAGHSYTSDSLGFATSYTLQRNMSNHYQANGAGMTRRNDWKMHMRRAGLLAGSRKQSRKCTPKVRQLGDGWNRTFKAALRTGEHHFIPSCQVFVCCRVSHIWGCWRVFHHELSTKSS